MIESIGRRVSMSHAFLTHLTDTLAQIEAEGLTKHERPITSP